MEKYTGSGPVRAAPESILDSDAPNRAELNDVCTRPSIEVDGSLGASWTNPTPEDVMARIHSALLGAALLLGASSVATAQATATGPARTGRPDYRPGEHGHVADRVRDRREVRGDVRAVRHDERDLRGDRRELRADRRSGDLRELRHDRRDVARDAVDLRRDRRDLHHDRADVRRDRRPR